MGKNSNTYKTFNVHERTPEAFYNRLDGEFSFNHDPCPLNTAPDNYWLEAAWGRRCFINPPYGKAISAWLNKGLLEIQLGNTDLEVFLLPAYTDVKWFHEIVLPFADEIRFIKGRLRFGEHDNTAPFASMLAIFKRLEC